MADHIVLNPRDCVAILSGRATKGSVGAPLAAPVPGRHKIARQAIGAGEEILKFGQIIGHATSPIAAGEHVHSHNCAFSDHNRAYEIGADLA